jgi:hypothetical protein
VRDANRKYEFNYNGEVDNGMLIGAYNGSSDSKSSSVETTRM